MSMSYLFDLQKASVVDKGNGPELEFTGRPNFGNMFGSTKQVTQFNVENDASGAGTLSTGDRVDAVVNGTPIAGTYIGGVEVAFEPVGLTINAGEFAGLSVNFQVASVPGSIIEGADGKVYVLTATDFDKSKVIVTATIEFNGETVTVNEPFDMLIERLATAASTIDPRLEDFVWEQESGWNGQVNGSRPSTPLTTDPAKDFIIPSGEIGDIVCFVAGTMVATPSGEVAIETLALGDLVLTGDNGAQPMRWIGTRTLSAADLARAPKLLPIRIKAGALGDGCPARDLLVSPQHRVLIRSKIAMRMFGTPEVLVAAKQLLQLDGIDIATDLEEVTYVHILFDRHEIVLSNGAETESLYTGAEALKSIGAAAAEEVFALFPELRDEGHVPAAARPLLSGRNGRKLAMRHMHNQQPLIATLS